MSISLSPSILLERPGDGRRLGPCARQEAHPDARPAQGQPRGVHPQPFAKAGWKITTDSRSYRPSIDDPELDGRFVRAQEVSRYVEHGFFDCGLTGLDWIQENGSDVVEVCDLIYSRASVRQVALGALRDRGFAGRGPKDLAGKRVATELVRP
jgi:ATP phosphoribosyltransferase